MQSKPIYTNLFPNSARSIRIAGEVAHYSGRGALCAIKGDEGGFILQSSEIGLHDERMFGRGVMVPTANKTSQKTPDFRGWIVMPEDDRKWLVAAWWKLTKENIPYLSLTLTVAEAEEPRSEQWLERRQDSVPHSDAPPQAELFSARNEPTPAEQSPAITSAKDPLHLFLRRFIERAECANCAEDWAAVATLASEAREMLDLAA